MKSFLNRLRSNPKSLLGPNIVLAPVHEVDFNLATLRFKMPDATYSVDFTDTVKRFDPLSNESYPPKIKSEQFFLSETLSRRGWAYTSGFLSVDCRGSLIVNIMILKMTDLDDLNLSSELDMKKWILKAKEYSYSSLNKELVQNFDGGDDDVDRFKKQQLVIYPRKYEDIEVIEIRKQKWFYYTVKNLDNAPKRFYETSLFGQNILMITFTPSRGDIDFYSADTNFPEAVQKTQDEFMSNVFIEYNNGKNFPNAVPQ